MPGRGYDYWTVTIPINTAVGTTIVDSQGNAHNSIPFHWYAAGFVRMPANWTDADLGLKNCYFDSEVAADYLPFVNDDGVKGTTAADSKTMVVDGISTSEAKDYQLPFSWFAAAFGRPHSVNRSTGADVNQAGAAKTIIVGLKT
jgi:hypothetical protein